MLWLCLCTNVANGINLVTCHFQGIRRTSNVCQFFSFSLSSLARFVIFVCIIIMMDHENVTETNGCILGGLCLWFVPLLRFLYTRLVGWNPLKTNPNKVKNCEKHSPYMLAIAICPGFTITISSINFSCVLYKSNFRSYLLSQRLSRWFQKNNIHYDCWNYTWNLGHG